jgi:hypothetical protein
VARVVITCLLLLLSSTPASFECRVGPGGSRVAGDSAYPRPGLQGSGRGCPLPQTSTPGVAGEAAYPTPAPRLQGSGRRPPPPGQSSRAGSSPPGALLHKVATGGSAPLNNNPKFAYPRAGRGPPPGALVCPPSRLEPRPRHARFEGHFPFSAEFVCMGKQKNRLTGLLLPSGLLPCTPPPPPG